MGNDAAGSSWSRLSNMLILAAFVLSACGETAREGPAARGAAASPRPAQAPAQETIPTNLASGKREQECGASQIFWPYCYSDGWSGNTPRGLAMFGGPGKERLEGLAHILENGSSRRVKLLFDKESGVCGEIVEMSGTYHGSTYTGLFFCNKTALLPTASDLPEKTATTENFLIGTWEKTDPKAIKAEIWTFLPDGHLNATGSKKRSYKYFGPSFATKDEGENTWWVYQITGVSPRKITFKNASPEGLSRTVYTLTKNELPQNAPSAATLPQFKDNEPYGTFRQELVAQGWTPYTSPDASKCEIGDKRCAGRPEMEYCTSAGSAQCKFLWTRDGTTVAVFTAGEVEGQVIEVARAGQ